MGCTNKVILKHHVDVFVLIHLHANFSFSLYRETNEQCLFQGFCSLLVLAHVIHHLDNITKNSF